MQDKRAGAAALSLHPLYLQLACSSVVMTPAAWAGRDTRRLARGSQAQ